MNFKELSTIVKLRTGPGRVCLETQLIIRVEMQCRILQFLMIRLSLIGSEINYVHTYFLELQFEKSSLFVGSGS